MAVAWYVLEVAHRLLDVREVREVQIHATPQWRPHLFEMKVGNQRIVVALIFAFCLIALPALERGRKLGLGTNPEFVRSVLFHDGITNALLGKPEIALQRLTLAANKIAAAHPEAPEDAVLADLKLLDAFGIAALRISKLPSDLAALQIPVVRLAGRAQALIALQDRVSAETEFKQLLPLYPSEPGVHYMYGVFLLKGHPPLAI